MTWQWCLFPLIPIAIVLVLYRLVSGGFTDPGNSYGEERTKKRLGVLLMKRGNKKLGISAETVRVISGKELTEVQGGWPSEVPTNTCTSYPGGSGAGSIYECMSALCRTM